MKITELRPLIEQYTNEQLKTLIVEIYKAIPKKLKEAKEIDDLIINIQTGKEKKKVKKQEEQINLEDLKREIELFLKCAYKQYYLAPNNIIHKKDRPKWRFIVKRYFKDLQLVKPTGESDELTIVDLMKKLYEMLCYACGYYLFNTEDPFRSVGIEQTELYNQIISRNFNIGKNSKSVKFAIDLLINNHLDRETTYSSLMEVLMKQLTNIDLKIITIEQCKLVIKELKTKVPGGSKLSQITELDYYKKEMLNNLVKMIFRCHVSLFEYDEAIQFFNKNYASLDNEIKLYVLLDLLLKLRLKEQWKTEFENAVKNKIKPRESLKKAYSYLKEHDDLPRYIY